MGQHCLHTARDDAFDLGTSSNISGAIANSSAITAVGDAFSCPQTIQLTKFTRSPAPLSRGITRSPKKSSSGKKS